MNAEYFGYGVTPPAPPGEAEFFAENIITVPFNAAAKAITTPAAGYGWSPWYQLIAANAVTSDFVIIGICNSGANESYYAYIEIGTGASGSEAAIIQLPWNEEDTAWLASGKSGPTFWPRKVDANSRVSVRASTSSLNVRTLYFTMFYSTL